MTGNFTVLPVFSLVPGIGTQAMVTIKSKNRNTAAESGIKGSRENRYDSEEICEL